MNQNKTLSPNQREHYPKPAGNSLAVTLRQPSAVIPFGLGMAATGILWVFHYPSISLIAMILTLCLLIRKVWNQQAKQLSSPEDDPVKILKRALSKAQYLENINSTFAEKALEQLE